MAVQFYNVKTKERVKVDESDIKKASYGAGTSKRYAFKAVSSDGTRMTKFCSKSDWEGLKVPEG